MAKLQKITPHLWFDNQAEDAAKFYTSIFKNSSIGDISRYAEAGKEIHGQKPGSVMTVSFRLEGQDFLALNGGPIFKFNESISFMIFCDDQQEIDHYWDKLTQGGDPKSQQCGWLKDKFGLSWQVTPSIMPNLMSSGDSKKIEKVMAVVMSSKKFDLAKLKEAAA